MASKFLVPLHLANFATTPASPTNGFVKVYIKNQFLTYLAPNGVETDVVLSRPLTNFNNSANALSVTSSDNLLQAINKLQASFRTFELTGDVTGTGLYSSNKFVVQTNVASINFDVTDYDYHISGSKDSVNKIFSLRHPFVSGSTKVFLNGIRLTQGEPLVFDQYDYLEIQPNQIEFTEAPDGNDLIIVDYKK
jgi:hypothetical protein